MMPLTLIRTYSPPVLALTIQSDAVLSFGIPDVVRSEFRSFR